MQRIIEVLLFRVIRFLLLAFLRLREAPEGGYALLLGRMSNEERQPFPLSQHEPLENQLPTVLLILQFGKTLEHPQKKEKPSGHFLRSKTYHSKECSIDVVSKI